jgi:hypothetical protein
LDSDLRPKEAQRAARIELGGIEQVKEQVREERVGNGVHSVISDCCYGLRQLHKNPRFTVVAVLTLAPGIGANTAIFSLIDTLLLRSLPARDPERSSFSSGPLAVPQMRTVIPVTWLAPRQMPPL